ncbi:MAG: carbamoyl-phosphate synthase (glutamine-hydrolyzing) large subunit [Sulfolobales archaeon]
MELPSKVVVIGSGAIKIAEAAEFDYSGSQALKALKEEGIKTVLINPNVATIQTSHELADRVYLVPIRREFVEAVIERERPDGILLGFGGQSALSIGVTLEREGVLSRYGVKVYGTPVDGIEKALNRELFKETMRVWSLPVPMSGAARSLREALEIANSVGYPVIGRVSFNLGGRGSFVAWNDEDLRNNILRALAHSEIRLVLIEKYLHNWKEIEFEVVRDRRGNSVAVACLENADPMGIHTGESVVIAPCQTLNDREYQLLRNASIKVAEAIGLIGECNVQLALNPFSEEFYIIETNPRMSRSSALASKATGYPLAYIAAKLALGYTLDEVINKVTGITCSCFEPSLDYVVVKVPRWDLEKFVGVERSLGSEMKSIGEVMAIGRNLYEAFQKAIRMLDIGEDGVVGGPYYEEDEELQVVIERLKKREPYWLLHVAKALRLGASVAELSSITGIDKYFIKIVKDLVDLAEEIRNSRNKLEGGDISELIAKAKEYGFSDRQLAKLLKTDVERIRNLRVSYGIRPYVKQIDTLAAEWPAKTNYLYLSYNGFEDDLDFNYRPKERVLVLGAGVFRIGVSVEFDWATVNLAKSLRKKGFEVIVVNYNPETVSTDWDINDKLYFEEITLETIRDIVSLERPLGVITSVGGQISNNLARKLEDVGIKLLGSSGYSIDRAEDRVKFSRLIEYLGIRQPPWVKATSVDEIMKVVDELGFPVIVRPSYVLSGTAMKVVYNLEDLINYLKIATKVSSEYPVIISKFIDNALEVEVDAVSDGRRVVGVSIEHVEPAGVHSGDATMVTPTRRLGDGVLRQIHEYALKLALELNIRGPFNIQYIVKDGTAYMLELNLRASRSMPFSSKSRGVNLMELAAQALIDGKLDIGVPDEYIELPAKCWAVKTPQFSWAQLRGAYPFLGPEMRSTGEVASLGRVFEDALLKSWLSATPNRIPKRGELIIAYTASPADKPLLSEALYMLKKAGYETLTIDEMYVNGFPSIRYSEALEYLKRGDVGMVCTSGIAFEKDYELRRLAVDLNIPLVLNANLAYEISKAIWWYVDKGVLEVMEMSEYWDL